MAFSPFCRPDTLIQGKLEEKLNPRRRFGLLELLGSWHSRRSIGKSTVGRRCGEATINRPLPNENGLPRPDQAEPLVGSSTHGWLYIVGATRLLLFAPLYIHSLIFSVVSHALIVANIIIRTLLHPC